MNTPIFKQVYRYMFTQQWEEIAGYDWVVKVDADTVMLPDRLQRQLRSRDPRQGMVLGSKIAWVGSPKSGQSYAVGLDGPVIPISRAVSMSCVWPYTPHHHHHMCAQHACSSSAVWCRQC